MERIGTYSLRRAGFVLVTALVALVAAAPVALAATAPPVVAPAAVDAPTSDAPVAPEVDAAVSGAAGEARVIALTDAPGEQVVDDIVADLPEGSATPVSAGRTNQVALVVDADGLDALKASPQVERIIEDRPNRIDADLWLSTAGAPEAQGAGWDGTGRTVAVLDTGVQADHPYLAGKVVAEACFSHSVLSGSTVSLCPGGLDEQHGPGAATPCVGVNGCLHGTHVAGIAAGGPVATPSSLSGVAPAASIIAIQVFTKGTSAAVCGSVGATPCLLAYDSDIDAALDWILGRRLAGDPLYAGLDAINLSLGGGLFSGPCDSVNTATTSLVENLRDAGIATVIAAGNNGQSGRPGTQPKMSSPACISSAVSVGATTGSLSGVVATYSNLTANTTILAPGSSVLSSEPGSTYGLLSGTSMATPVVAGAMAAIREQAPSTSVDALVTRMQGTGDVVSTPVGGRRQVRVDLAVQTVSPNLPAGSPFGSLDVARSDIGAVSVSGWAIDPDTAGAPLVQVSLDGVATTVTASTARPDVAAVFPGYGARHGWTAQLVASPGPHTVCAAALNTGAGANALLSCRSVVVLQGPPFGSLDLAAAGIGSVNVGGWVIDPDTSDPVQVHVYVDGAAMALLADGSRPDVAAAFGGYGPSHGYSATFGATPGPHTVCAYGINVGAGANSLLGCRTVTVAGGSPIGSLDAVTRNPDGSIGVSGWAIDPDTNSPVQVWLYAAGNGYPLTGPAAVTANGSRPDVGAVFPLFGPMRGYSGTVGSATPAGVAVCAYALNAAGAGTTSVLGCRVVP